MHKKLIFSITPLLLLLTLSFSLFIFSAGAQETATNTSEEASDSDRPTLEDRSSALEERQQERSELIDGRQEVRTERVEERAELRDERQTVLTKMRQQRVLNLSANISNRMEAAIDRLFNIIERLEERISKLNTAGVNTDAASAKLREAAQLLASARATLGNIDTLVIEATTAPEPKTAWQAVRAVYQQAGTEIRASHLALRETISLLKQAIANGSNQTSDSSDTEESASTTPASE